MKELFMKEALIEASKAFEKNEVPVGAVVVFNNTIIGRGHNLRETNQSFLAHAEIIALNEATKAIGSWRLEDCDIYTTLEPCQMCAGAMLQARLRKVYFGATDLKSGATNSIIKMFDNPWNHQVLVEGGIMEKESSEIIRAFFQVMRKK